jgi:hypothetical protein
MSKSSSRPRSLRFQRTQIGEVLQGGVEAERCALEKHHAGIDFRQVENVVDDAEQALGGVINLAEIVALPRR